MRRRWWALYTADGAMLTAGAALLGTGGPGGPRVAGSLLLGAGAVLAGALLTATVRRPNDDRDRDE
jgi:hypothetical protein